MSVLCTPLQVKVCYHKYTLRPYNTFTLKVNNKTTRGIYVLYVKWHDVG